MACIDPVKSSPDNYKVLIENDKVRLLEMTVKAGTSDIEHSHPAEMVTSSRVARRRCTCPTAAPWKLSSRTAA